MLVQHLLDAGPGRAAIAFSKSAASSPARQLADPLAVCQAGRAAVVLSCCVASQAAAQGGRLELLCRVASPAQGGSCDKMRFVWCCSAARGAGAEERSKNQSDPSKAPPASRGAGIKATKQRLGSESVEPERNGLVLMVVLCCGVLLLLVVVVLLL